jgi:DNA-binding MarR family transcriptional regulator
MGPHTDDASEPLPLVTNLQRAVHVLGVHLEQALGELRLSQAEMHVLSLLGQVGTRSVAELQRNVRHRPSTLTSILDRLESRGMVVRRINAADRRSNLIELTPDGHAAAKRVLQAMAEIEVRLLDGCPPEEAESFMRLLNAVPWKL